MEQKGEIVQFPVLKPVKRPSTHITIEAIIQLNPSLAPNRRTWWYDKGWEITSESKLELVPQEVE